MVSHASKTYFTLHFFLGKDFDVSNEFTLHRHDKKTVKVTFVCFPKEVCE